MVSYILLNLNEEVPYISLLSNYVYGKWPACERKNQMKRNLALILLGVILLSLSSCAAPPSADKTENSSGGQASASSQAPTGGETSSKEPALSSGQAQKSGRTAPGDRIPSSSRSPASSANSNGTKINQIASDIAFREGTAKDGKAILSSSDLIGFYTGDDTFDHSYKMIGFKLKECAEKSFSEATERLAKSGGTLSLWAGEDRLNSSTLSDPIIGDTFVLSHLEEDQLNSICKKLKSAD